MKIKNANLKRLIIGLGQIGELSIPIFKLNYAIGRNLEKMTTLGKSYDKSLEALINKHAQIDDKGLAVTINDEYDFKSKKDRETFIKNKIELDEIENEVELWKLKTSVLEKVMKKIKCDKCDAEKEVCGLNGILLYKLNEIIIDDANILGKPNESENNIPKKSEVASS